MNNIKDVVPTMKQFGYFYIRNFPEFPKDAVSGDVVRVDGQIYVYDGSEWQPSSEEEILRNAGLLRN